VVRDGGLRSVVPGPSNTPPRRSNGGRTCCCPP